MANSDQRELRTVIDALTETEVASVLDFARYLRDQRPLAPEPVPEILDIPRPEGESVINAIRRLTRTYPMLNRDTLFDEASGLMARHMMHGETSEDTIDQLETLFKSRYATWQAESAVNPSASRTGQSGG